MCEDGPLVDRQPLVYALSLQGSPPETGTGLLLPLLCDISDDAPILRFAFPCYGEVCESVVGQSFLLEPPSDPFMFELV